MTANIMTNYKEYEAGGRPPRPHWQQGKGQHYVKDRCTRQDALSLPKENSSAVAETKVDVSHARDQAHATTPAAAVITSAPHVKGKVEYYTSYASDCVLGFNIQPSILKRLPNAAIAPGRVSAHILRMVCDKEHQIRAFNARQLRTMEAEFKLSDGRLLIAQLLEADGLRIYELGMMSKEQRQALPVRIHQAVFKVHQAGIRSATCLVLCTKDGAFKFRIPATLTHSSRPHPYVSQLKVGQTVTGLQMRAPPPRYTVASIAIAMLKAGLGGISSNAATVSKLVKEGMLKVKEEGGPVIPTPGGKQLAKALHLFYLTYTSSTFPDSMKNQHNLLPGSVKSGPDALVKSWKELIGTYRTLRDVKMEAACSLLHKVLRQYVFVSPANRACSANSNGQPQQTLAKSQPTIKSSNTSKSDIDRSQTIKLGTSTAAPCTTPQSVQITASDLAPQSAHVTTSNNTAQEPAHIATNTAHSYQPAQAAVSVITHNPSNFAASSTQLDVDVTVGQDSDTASSDTSDDDVSTAPSDTDEEDSLSDKAEHNVNVASSSKMQQNVNMRLSEATSQGTSMAVPSKTVATSKLYTNRPTRAMPSEQPQVAFSYELGGIKLEITEDLSVSVSITPTMTGILTTIGAIGTIGFALWRRRR